MAGRGSQPSVMKHTFSEVPRADIPRSQFDRSHGYKTTFDAGFLVPFFVDEALPGDTFNLRSACFARMNTPIFPIMDNLYMDTFYFFVPNRLIWDNWEKMMGEQEDPGDSTDYLVPTVSAPAGTGWPEGLLMDYFGIPTDDDTVECSALFGRAYTLIYNEWFRDQNLQDSRPLSKDDGPDPWEEHYFAEARGKRHDYFTSALPWPQKGPDVSLPIGTFAPVVRGNQPGGTPPTDWAPEFAVLDVPVITGALRLESGEGNTVNFAGGGGPGATDPLYWADPKLHTDLSSATAATINQIRQAFQIQKMYERDARGGTRYIEIIRSHFGVTSPDARLQRPEYLGGGSTPINISPITATADTSTDVQSGRELASLAAVGTASFNGHGFNKSFVEHGIILGLVSVRADLTYQQGINRMWNRQDRLDFYWPVLSHLGEQEVLNKEIYWDEATNDLVFGYQERYAEYRYKPSQITGRFRSSSAASLDAWHLSEDFANLPVLGNQFIKSLPPVDRVVATPDEPHFIADFYHKLICARPMPLYGVPGNIDRF